MRARSAVSVFLPPLLSAAVTSTATATTVKVGLRCLLVAPMVVLAYREPAVLAAAFAA